MKNMLLIVCLSPLALTAQRSMQKYYQLHLVGSRIGADQPYFYGEQTVNLKLRQQLGIREIRITDQSKKKEEHTVLTYNRAGRMIHWSGKNRTTDYTYQDDTLVTEILTQRKGKTYRTSSAYEQGKLVSSRYYINGKLSSTNILAYDPLGKLAASSLTEGRKKYEIRYDYNGEGKLRHTSFYVKGKLKKEWVYECKPEGEALAAKTEVISSFCNYREESADGSFTNFSRILQEGKPYLLKQTYNKDSVLQLTQRFYNDSILIWKSDRMNPRVEVVSSFRKSGKRIYMQKSTFSDKGELLSREYYRKKEKKPMSRSEFRLNMDGTTNRRLFYRKGKRSYSSYQYLFF